MNNRITVRGTEQEKTDKPLVRRDVLIEDMQDGEAGAGDAKDSDETEGKTGSCAISADSKRVRKEREVG